MREAVEATIARARRGDSAALEALIAEIQGKVYDLAVRMLWHPEDAKDATQEILFRVVTHLGSFRGESNFFTWVYRIAANHLLSWRKSRAEAQELTFEAFGKDLEEGLSDIPRGADDLVLLQEIRVGCTLGMLLCLDRSHRLSYILGEILELDSKEAASILGINRATFRKRLERARSSILEFMQARCGLANPENRCRCSRRIDRAIELGRLNPGSLLFAGDHLNAQEFPKILSDIRKLRAMQRTVALFRSHPEYTVPNFVNAVKTLLLSGERTDNLTKRGTRP